MLPGTKPDRDDYVSAHRSERTGLLTSDDDDDGRDSDFLLRGPSAAEGGGGTAVSAAASGSDRLAAVRTQVSEVTGVMRQNAEKLMDRGAGLDQLEEQSEYLTATSDDFYITSRQVQRRIYLRDLKMKVALAAVILILMLVIILPIILKS